MAKINVLLMLYLDTLCCLSRVIYINCCITKRRYLTFLAQIHHMHMKNSTIKWVALDVDLFAEDALSRVCGLKSIHTRFCYYFRSSVAQSVLKCANVNIFRLKYNVSVCSLFRVIEATPCIWHRVVLTISVIGTFPLPIAFWVTY